MGPACMTVPTVFYWMPARLPPPRLAALLCRRRHLAEIHIGVRASFETVDGVDDADVVADVAADDDVDVVADVVDADGVDAADDADVAAVDAADDAADDAVYDVGVAFDDVDDAVAVGVCC